MARHPLVRTAARVTAGALMATAALSAFAGGLASAAGGNNGTVKLGSAGVPFTNANDPHLTCPIQIQWSGFDDPATYSVSFSGVAPTGGTVTAAEPTQNVTFHGGTNIATFTLTITGATPNNKGEDHIGVDINTTDASGSDFKQKTVWVTPCTARGGSMTVSGACNTTNNGYVWTVHTTPATQNIAGAYGATGQAQSSSFTTGATGSTTFTTALSTPSIDWHATTAGWTGSGSNVAASPACTPTGTVAVSGACNANNNGYDWTVTTTPGTSGIAGAWGPAGQPQSNTFTTGAGGTTSFATLVGVPQVDWHSTTAGWTGSGTATTAATICPGQPTPASATASATCTLLTAHLVPSSAAGGTTFTVTANGTSHTITTTTPVDVQYPSAPGAVITVVDAANNTVTLASATAPANCGSPPHATVKADCGGLSAHLVPSTAAAGTTFDVIVGGVHHLVTATSPQDVSYPWSSGAVITVVDSADPTTVLATATAPTSCGPPPAAKPTLASGNSCTTGISVQLGNLDGTAPVTFTVTKPDGTTETVDVRSGQIVKKSYAVKEDTTGTVSVSAPGLSARTVSYAKNCVNVLGEKVVRTVKKPVVQGEKVTRLPFTGLDASQLLRLAGLAMGAGVVLMLLAGRRRRA